MVQAWCGRLERPVCRAALALSLLTLPGEATANDRRSVNLFAGVLTDNEWEEVVGTPWNLDIQDPGLVGLSWTFGLGGDRVTRFGTVSFEVEPQIVRHAGFQDHWEMNLPFTVRLRPEQPQLGIIDTFAFGIGPSWASSPPPLEQDRGDGDVEQWLIYWHAELEHDLRSSPGSSLFLRLHHRSDGFGLVGNGASSNAVVFGIKRDF